ncbi:MULTISPECIES: hypothetical protein [Haloarcula]|uniref:hypothetical protein n=1 Tax=Haloarcula TaxID=2237 RepID=UPI0023EC8C44|nr:hypothetical protein [Halomicroarcula sp. XH51]
MHDDPDGSDRATRRAYLQYGGALLASGLLAGCSGGNDGDGGGSTASETPTATATPEPTESADAEATASGGDSYAVEMAPAGRVEFDAPPETVTHYFLDYADMAVALGHGDTILSMGLPSRFHTSHYDELEGVSVDVDSITALNGDSGIDEEIFYELDADLHLIDPQWLVNNSFFGLEASDVDEIAENVAPFLGNTRTSSCWARRRRARSA